MSHGLVPVAQVARRPRLPPTHAPWDAEETDVRAQSRRRVQKAKAPGQGLNVAMLSADHTDVRVPRNQLESRRRAKFGLDWLVGRVSCFSWQGESSVTNLCKGPLGGGASARPVQRGSR